jgi:hypothetical protein
MKYLATISLVLLLSVQVQSYCFKDNPSDRCTVCAADNKSCATCADTAN